MHTAESDSAVWCTTRIFLQIRISRRNHNRIRKYFTLCIRCPEGFESWKNGGRKSRDTFPLRPYSNSPTSQLTHAHCSRRLCSCFSKYSTVYKYQVHKVHSYISMITRKNSAGNFVPTKISSSVIDTFYNHPKNATGIQATE